MLRQWSAIAALREYGRVEEGGREYRLWCLETDGARSAVVTTGFHGEEPAGPLTVARHFGEVAAYARKRKVALRVYPCINPSGFERGQRYNASGEHPNNDFLRYVSHGGALLEEVAPDQPFASWHTYEGGPKETRAVRADLGRASPPDAALDIHQDAWVKRACFYAYYFTERERTVALMRRCGQWAKPGVNIAVHDSTHTDRHGLIVHHDGSISDWFYRRGTRHVAVLETSTLVSRPACDALNLEWIRGYIDFAADG